MAVHGLPGPVCALTGTPGTGKTTVARILRDRGVPVLDLKRYVDDPRFDEGPDAAHHDAHVIDEAALNDHLIDHLGDELVAAQPGLDDAAFAGPVFIESHFAHELAIVDRILVLRCHPRGLERRLADRGWPAAKVRANTAAEAMDLILQEAADHRDEAAAEGYALHVAQVDTTDTPAEAVADEVWRLATTAPVNLQIAHLEWSREVLGWYSTDTDGPSTG